MEHVQEKAWIEQTIRGDQEAFGHLVTAYSRPAYFTALGILGNRDEAYDLSQEAFVRAYKAIDKFDRSRPFAPWFFRILRNCCLTFLSRRKVHASLDELREAGVEPAAGDRFDPSLLAERNDDIDRVWRALGALEDASREIIVLKDLQGHRYKEIAAILGIPEGTVMSRLYHARQKLKTILLEERAR